MAASLESLRTLELPPVSSKYATVARREDGIEDFELRGRLLYRCSWSGGLRHGAATSFHHGRLVHEIKFVKGKREGHERVFNEYGTIVYQCHWGDDRMSGYAYLWDSDGKSMLMSLFYIGNVFHRSEYRGNGEQFVASLGVDLKAPYNYDMVRKLIINIVERTDAIVVPAAPPPVVVAAAEPPPPQRTSSSSGSRIMGLIRSSSTKKLELRSSTGYQEAVQRQRSNSLVIEQVVSSSSSGPVSMSPVIPTAAPLILGDDSETFVFVDQWGKPLPDETNGDDLIELAAKIKRNSRRSLPGLGGEKKEKKKKKSAPTRKPS